MFQYYGILQNSHKHVPVLPYTTKLAQTRSSTTVYYKTRTNTFQYYRILQNSHKHVPVLPYTRKLAQSHSQYYYPYTTKLAQTRSSTTVYYKTRTNTFQYYRILQNSHTFEYYRILQNSHKHVPVLPYTRKLAQRHEVLQLPL